MPNQITENLKSQLIQFGLNPTEWKVKAIKKLQSHHINLHFYNSEEPSLQLSALALLKNKMTIQSLQII